MQFDLMKKFRETGKELIKKTCAELEENLKTTYFRSQSQIKNVCDSLNEVLESLEQNILNDAALYILNDAALYPLANSPPKLSCRKNKKLGPEWISILGFGKGNSAWITPYELYVHVTMPVFQNRGLYLKPGKRATYVHSEKVKELYLSEEGKKMFPENHRKLKECIAKNEKR